MSRIILSVLLFTLVTNVSLARAQDSTKIHPLGLFVAPEIGYMNFNKSLNLFGGLSFMILIRDQFGIGWSATNSASKVESQRVKLGSTGINVQYTIRPEKVFHFCLSIQSNVARLVAYPDSTTYEPSDIKRAQFLVLQPGIQAEYNLLKWLWPYLSINYRLAKTINNETDFASDFASGTSLGLGLKIGFFNVKIHKKKRQ